MNVMKWAVGVYENFVSMTNSQYEIEAAKSELSLIKFKYTNYVSNLEENTQRITYNTGIRMSELLPISGMPTLNSPVFIAKYERLMKKKTRTWREFESGSVEKKKTKEKEIEDPECLIFTCDFTEDYKMWKL